MVTFRVITIQNYGLWDKLTTNFVEKLELLANKYKNEKNVKRLECARIVLCEGLTWNALMLQLFFNSITNGRLDTSVQQSVFYCL